MSEDETPGPGLPKSLVEGSIQRGIDDAKAGRTRRITWATGEQLGPFETEEEEI